MQVLMFASCPTHPVRAGNSARAASIGERLQRLGHAVHFVYFDHQSPLTPEERRAMTEVWDSFHYIPFQPGLRPDRKGDPWQVDDWFQSDIGLHVRSLCAALKPDLAICHYGFHSRLFEFVNPEAVRVLDTHDVFSDRHRMLDAAGLPRRFYFTDRSTEARQLRRADLVLAIQDQEAAFFRLLVDAPVVTLGHLAEARPVERPDNPRPNVGFVGSGNAMNRQALDQYLAAASEDLAAGLYELVVVGAVGEGVPETRGVTCLGRIEDLEPVYASLDLAINPMTQGTGLKIKTIEALQHGVPLISTACGFEGLRSAEPGHALADVEAVAARVARLIRSPADLARLAAASRTLFESYSQTQSDLFDRLFRSREGLISFLGGAAKLEVRRNTSSRSVIIATHARFWRSGLGSHVRIRQLVEELCRPYRLIVFVTVRLNDEDRAAIAEMGLPIEVVGLEGEASRADDGSEDVLLGRRDETEVGEAFARLIKQCPPSVCIIEYLRLSYLVPRLPAHTVRIIDTHDLISRRQEARARWEQTAPVSRRGESEALGRYDFILAIQRTEAAVVDCWTGAHNGLYVPLAFEGRALSRRSGADAAIGFIGGDSDANLSGLRWFLEEVWPYFSLGGTRLRVAGGVCARFNAPVDGVDFIGPEDLEAFYGSIEIAVNPVQWGGGLKIKTVEAMSWGLPVVSSPQGAAGLEEAAGRGLTLAPTAPSFALGLGRLLHDPALRRAQGRAARQFVDEEFSRDAVFRDLHAVIQSASPNWPVRQR
jgi:glycosyltransferase involved in cell wall biosynthesis